MAPEIPSEREVAENAGTGARPNQNGTDAPSVPDELASLFTQAVRCHQSGDLANAVDLYGRVLLLKPALADVHFNRGIALAILGRLGDAEQSLRSAIALRPQFPDAFSALGNTLRLQGRLSDGETACRLAIALKADHAEANSNLGHALRDQGRLIEAETALRRAVALQPNFAEAYNDLGATLKELGRLDEARLAVEQAVRLMPRNPVHFLNLGELREFAAGDPYFSALQELAKSSTSLPAKQKTELHFALAKAYDDVGQCDESLQQLLAGNALKRRHVAYDETAASDQFKHIQTVFTPELMRTFQGAGEPSSVPVFVVGMPRSGTTLIEQILASHPQVFGAGELPNLRDAIASIGPAGARASSFPEPMPNISREELRRLGSRYVSEITALAPAARRIIDKMPSNFLFAGLIHLMLPHARIVHVVRDPFDTCMSCFSKLFTSGQNHTYDLAELGRYYRGYQALMEHWRRILPPGRILNVRYEDVVGDLESQARRIILHCGLAWNARCLAFHETERPVRTASAAQVRRPLYSGSIKRWQGDEPLLRPLRAALSGEAT